MKHQYRWLGSWFPTAEVTELVALMLEIFYFRTSEFKHGPKGEKINREMDGGRVFCSELH